jgi:hypothetical protein
MVFTAVLLCAFADFLLRSFWMIETGSDISKARLGTCCAAEAGELQVLRFAQDDGEVDPDGKRRR